MHLAEVHIERFRGIRRLTLALDPVTVIIGENDCGKSSVLDAIGVALSDRVFDDGLDAMDLHRSVDHGARTETALRRESSRDSTRSGVGIRLRFVELTPGEWPPAKVDRLDTIARPLSDGRLAVTLDVRLDRDGDRSIARVRFLDPAGEVIEVDVRAAHRQVRALVPFFHISADRPAWEALAPTLPGDGTSEGEDDSDSSGASGTDDELSRRLAGLHQLFIDPRRELAAFEGALHEVGALIDLTPEERASMSHSPDRITELLAARVAGARGTLPLRARGGGARGVVRLLLLASLLAVSGGAALDPLAHPILAIEDPEAHLHPTALAFLARMINGIRAQKIVVTHSGEVLAAVDATAIRRLVRSDTGVHVHWLRPGALTADEARRISYHVKARHGVALFARCWLLIEGETEFWLLPAIAQHLGHELWLDGIACVEFAQCGIESLVKLARGLGIEWHLLAEGDMAGDSYSEMAERFIDGESREERITPLSAASIELCLWRHGYADVYRKAAGIKGHGRRNERENPGRVIAAAIKMWSKPRLAVAIIDAMRDPDGPGVPEPLRRAIARVGELSRRSPAS